MNNERQPNADLLALHEAGVDTPRYEDAAAALTALKAGALIPSTIVGDQAQMVVL